MAAYVAETGERIFVKDILGVMRYFMSISPLAFTSQKLFRVFSVTIFFFKFNSINFVSNRFCQESQ